LPSKQLHFQAGRNLLNRRRLQPLSRRVNRGCLFAGMLFIAMLVQHELQKGSLLYQRLTAGQSLPGLPGFTCTGFKGME
jgi:hypothetical protein